MADEKKNTGQEQTQQPSLFDAGPAGAHAPEPPAPEQAAVEPPAPEAPAGAPGEVVVSADQIERLMAERNAAARAEVEKKEPSEPEQPPAPAPKEKAAEDKTPTPEEKPKGRRGRKPKEEKAEPAAPKGTGPRRGRPPKAGKVAPDKAPSPPRDKMGLLTK